MGFVGSLFGGTSGNAGGAGLNFQGGDYTGQINNNQQQQQQFINALSAQNGIQNQSNVLNQQQQLYGQGQGLYNQLGQVAAGQGPNPAQAMLQQATNANNATTAGMIASQRGINPGLAARLGAEQGASNQQNAAAQGASMQAQQSLQALGQQQGLLGTQQGLLGQQAGLTSNMVGNQFGALQNQGAQLSALQNTATGANAGVAQQTAQQQGNLFSNLSGGAAKGLMLAAKGGEVKQNYASGGAVSSFGQAYNNFGAVGTPSVGSSGSSDATNQNQQAVGTAMGKGIKSLFSGSQSPQSDAMQMPELGDSQFSSQSPNLGIPGVDSSSAAGPSLGSDLVFAKGGKVPALVSPQEVYIPPKGVEEIKKGKKSPLEAGKKIPGKPKVGGKVDTEVNDTVPKTLEEGGIVLPRSVTQAKHPNWAAHKFVSAIIAKQGMKRK